MPRQAQAERQVKHHISLEFAWLSAGDITAALDPAGRKLGAYGLTEHARKKHTVNVGRKHRFSGPCRLIKGIAWSHHGGDGVEQIATYVTQQSDRKSTRLNSSHVS